MAGNIVSDNLFFEKMQETVFPCTFSLQITYHTKFLGIFATDRSWKQRF